MIDGRLAYGVVGVNAITSDFGVFVQLINNQKIILLKSLAKIFNPVCRILAHDLMDQIASMSRHIHGDHEPHSISISISTLIKASKQQATVSALNL